MGMTAGWNGKSVTIITAYMAPPGGLTAYEEAAGPPVETQMWQDAYAALLRNYQGNYFYFCDMDGHKLCYDGEVCGYVDDWEGNRTEWFQGADGERIMVTEENEAGYVRFLEEHELERHIVTDELILKVLYGVGAEGNRE